MRRLRHLLLASAFAAGAIAPPALAPAVADPVYQSQTLACTHSAQFAGASGTAQLVAAGTGTAVNAQIYICGWDLVPTAAATVQFEYGTGTNCGTGTQTITPEFSISANEPLIDHQPYYAGFTPIPAGQNLCMVVGGTGPVPGLVFYTQF